MVPQSERLAPGFLVAMPELRDPNFRRTVILLTSHGEDGAMGFVTNRTLPATVPEVLDGLDVPWRGRPSEPVWSGGPVMPQTGWVLFTGPPGGAVAIDADEVMEGLYLSASLETLRSLGKRPPSEFRLLLGYAGWGPGQLESELLQGSWLTLPADRELIFSTPPDEMWTAAFKRLGIHPGTIVPGHGVQ